MRGLIAATLAASLFMTNLAVANDSAPLAPGHAAGVKQADMIDTSLLIVLGVAAAVAIIAISVSGGGSVTPLTPPPSTGTS
jgi:hypothetical protein